MRLGGRYVLGIDALPRGNYAAIVVGHTITHTFAIAREGRLILPLEERVRLAVEVARRQRGMLPSEVRLVCVDDGADGGDLGRLRGWLADQQGITIRVLEPDVADLAAGASISTPASAGVGTAPSGLAGSAPASTLVRPAPVEGGDDARSVSRACEAALW